MDHGLKGLPSEVSYAEESLSGCVEQARNFQIRQPVTTVYGTHPSTAVNITCHRDEFVVRGEPRVGEQEYRVEKGLVRQTMGCHKVAKPENEKKKKKNEDRNVTIECGVGLLNFIW